MDRGGRCSTCGLDAVPADPHYVAPQVTAYDGRGSERCKSARPPNKGMKQTKPSILELRSLSPVLDVPSREEDLA